jgi:hypothetical protein
MDMTDETQKIDAKFPEIVRQNKNKHSGGRRLRYGGACPMEDVFRAME